VVLEQGSLAPAHPNEETRRFIYDDQIIMIFNHAQNSTLAAMVDKEEGEIDKEEYLSRHIMQELP